MTTRIAVLILLVSSAALGQTATSPAAQRPGEQSADFVAPVATSHPDARYTDKALKHRREGTVVLAVGLDSKGSVIGVKETSKKLGDGLDRRAIEAVKTWTFQPARKGGQGVASQLVVEVTFHIAEGNGTASESAVVSGATGAALPVVLAPEPAVIYSVGGDVLPPRPVHTPDPPYSDGARRHKIRGIVILSVGVNAAGRVFDVRMITPLEPGLDRNAMEAVKTWKFEPATLHGVPVAVRMLVEVTFKIF